jgi:adenosylcobyric acid synthase
MTVASLMIQGCGSDVGKSVLVAGLCRLFTNRGIVVRPFKSQNMSNNAAVTLDGGEIGRAQALQAQACRTTPTVDMNPVLLKPQSDVGAQLIVRGRMAGTLDASAHGRDKRALLDVAVESYRRLSQDSQLMIVEGAGSPAETNLRSNDIANMGLAQALGLPVVLVGDIDRGHVIASLVGAHVVLDPADRAMIRGFIINKFRGNGRLFDEGLRRISDLTGWRSIGVVPWLPAASRLPSEDGVQLERLRALRPSRPHDLPPLRSERPLSSPTVGARVKIAVPQLSRIANFDEFDPLRDEPEVELVYVPPGRPIPRDTSLIVIPGTKATIADMDFMRSVGWDIDIQAHVRHGGCVLGVCGGYQMLGRSISDPDGIEGSPRTIPGLGLLDVQTVMTGDKTLREVSGVLLGPSARQEGGPRSHPFGLRTDDPGEDVPFAGYEMHVGSTTGLGAARPFLRFSDGTVDGAVSADGRVAGCYVHGLFGVTTARAALVASVGANPNYEEHSARVDAALDEIADILEQCLDIAALRAIAGL